jgi:hypothetical protein
MAIAYIRTLEAIWDFFKPILGDLLKDRLKTAQFKDPGESPAFELFVVLDALNRATSAYIKALALYAKEAKTSASVNDAPDSANMVSAKNMLVFTMSHLSSCMTSTGDLVSELNLPLQIHLPEFVREEEEHRVLRRQNLDWLWPHLLLDKSASSAELDHILEEATKNAKLIQDATEDYRAFLKKQYSFKDIVDARGRRPPPLF